MDEAIFQGLEVHFFLSVPGMQPTQQVLPSCFFSSVDNILPLLLKYIPTSPLRLSSQPPVHSEEALPSLSIVLHPTGYKAATFQLDHREKGFHQNPSATLLLSLAFPYGECTSLHTNWTPEIKNRLNAQQESINSC